MNCNEIIIKTFSYLWFSFKNKQKKKEQYLYTKVLWFCFSCFAVFLADWLAIWRLQIVVGVWVVPFSSLFRSLGVKFGLNFGLAVGSLQFLSLDFRELYISFSSILFSFLSHEGPWKYVSRSHNPWSLFNILNI